MSANNQNLAGLSKRDSTMNMEDGKSLDDDSYGGERDGSISEEDEDEANEKDEEESYSNRVRPNTRNR